MVVPFLITILLTIFLFSFTANAGTVQLPQTGQTACYDSAGVVIPCTGTGQDGEILAGVALPSPRFTVSGDCVTDNLSGLMWTKDANVMVSQDPGFDTDGTAGDGAVNWQHALDYANGLSLCGYTDWCLPNRKELYSLTDFSRYSPALPSGHPFLNVQSDGYWLSTTISGTTSKAWLVPMWGGNIYDDFKSQYYGYFVWAVRAG